MIMKNTMRISVALVAVVLAASHTYAVTPAATNAPSSSASKMAELFGDTVVAKGDGLEVKRSELDSVVVNAKAAAATRGQPVPPQFAQVFEQQMLARIIQVKLLLKKATDADRIGGKERAEKRLETLVKRGASQDMIDLQIKAMGLTKDEFFSRIVDEATAEMVAERELEATISDEEAKKYYEEHPSQFEEPEKVRASHILMMTIDPTNRKSLTDEQKAEKKKKIEGLLKRARDGEDFATLAKEHTEDIASRETGGEYTFPRGQMVPEFEAAAFSMQTNQISDIVTTAFGYHIIKVSEKTPARKVPYDEVAENLKEVLRQQAMIKKLPAYMAKLRKDFNVEILDEKLIPKEEPDEMPGAPTITTPPATQPR
jgi:peptidyl-prolyl cis-trans isomerase C